MMKLRAVLLELSLVACVGATSLLGPARTALADDTVAAPREPSLLYVLLRDKDSATMSGSTDDLARAKQHRQGSEPMMWFREGGHEYVIRDLGLLAQIEETRRPLTELGEQMGKLGTKMGDLGKKQGELGRQQSLIGVRQGTLAVREASLSMRESRQRSDADRVELARQRQVIADQARALDVQMESLGTQMAALGTKMEPLSREMNVLSTKMQVLLRKVEGELHVQIKRAIASGLAKRV